jgi:uncharacterized protein
VGGLTRARRRAAGRADGASARLAVLILLCVTPVLAQAPPPALTGPVNDFANVIDGDSARTLEELSLSLERASGDAVVVATVDTVRPDYADLQEYAVKMFENGGRGIGQKGKDNGVLVVVAVRDRQVRIEVGYDLEQFVTDGFAGQVSRLDMVPAFRSGDYGQGLVAGVTRIVDRIAEGRNVQLGDRPAPRINVRSTGSGGGLIMALFVLFIVLNALGRRGRRRSRYWGGAPWSTWHSGVGPFGGRGGGFGGFGGGGFGGGFGGFGGGRSGGGGGGAGW